MTMVSNQLSRQVEARADAFSLELTGEPETFIGFQQRIAVKNIGDVDPPALYASCSAPTRRRCSGSGWARRSSDEVHDPRRGEDAPALRRRRRALREAAARPRARRGGRGQGGRRRRAARCRTAPTSCCSTRGRAPTRPRFARWLEDRRQAGRDVCFVIGGAVRARRCDARRAALVRPDDVPAPARPRAAARAALPRPQDPRRRAVPPLSRVIDRPQRSTTSAPRSQAAAGELRANGAADRLSLERPKKAGFGDYSTNAAMLLAPVLGEPPRAIAEKLGPRSRSALGDRVEKVEVAGPGFLNLFLSDAWYLAARRRGVLDAGDALRRRRPRRARPGGVRLGQPDRPATAASGRHAAFGDALARILELAGDTVEREYYFNDGGGQVRRLGESILARARGEAAAGGRLPGRVRRRASPRGSPARRTSRPTSSPRRASSS